MLHLMIIEAVRAVECRSNTKWFKRLLLTRLLTFLKINAFLRKFIEFPIPDGAPGTGVSGIGDPRTSGDRGTSGDRAPTGHPSSDKLYQKIPNIPFLI